VLLQQDDVSWGPNNKFKYPLRGGTGALYVPFLKYVGDHLHLNKTAIAIDPIQKQIRFSDGEVVSYDRLLSTMPLDLLVGQLTDTPQLIREAPRGLHHSSGLIVGVGIKRPTPSQKCWLYFPEPSSPFYRVTYLSNYSPYMTPDDQHFLLLSETSYSEHKPENKANIIDRVIQGMHATKLIETADLDRIASTYLIDVDYSYPVPTIDRNKALSTIQPYLMAHDIFSRGRFGAWEYEIGNMDHSVMQGVELVNHWLNGEPEITWKNFVAKAPITVADIAVNIPAQAENKVPLFISKSGSGLIQAGEQRFSRNDQHAPV
jgi:protoporphyrinogen oxidase